MVRHGLGRFAGGLALVAAAVGAGAGIALIPLGAGPSGAATTITVNDASDNAEPPSNCTGVEGDCTLRAALNEAGTLSGGVTISLPDPNSVEFNHAAQYQVLTSELVVAAEDPASSITIDGAGAGTSVIQAQCTGGGCTIALRVFDISADTTAVISGVTIEDGNISGDSGAGILNDGTLTLDDSTVTDNTTNDNGGGIDNQGQLTVQSSTFVGNSASGRGGAIDQEDDVSTTLVDDTISDNLGSGDGGGVYADSGTVSITGGTIGGTGSTSPGDQGNSTDDCGGGLALDGAAGTVSDVTFGGSDTTQGNTATTCGGGVYITTGDPSFSGDTVSHNSAQQGGGFYVADGTNAFTDETISDNTATSAGGAGIWTNGGTNTFTNDTVDGNQATGSAWGGGYYLFSGANTITGGSISSNLAYEGGGVFVDSGGATNTFTQTTIAGNTATEAGGGLAFGTAQAGSTSITASTISGNTVEGTVGISEILGDGGGILATECNAITLINDTIASNTAVNGGGYFGSECAESPTVTTAFRFDTISANAATNAETGAGNIQAIDDSTLTMADSVVAGGISGGSPTTNCAFSGPGSFTSEGYNLVDDPTCGTAGTGDIIGQSAQLGSLGNNGGPTQTEVPGSSSPAIGAIPSSVCTGTGVSTDQRGVARGSGANGTCTIGAVEVAASAPIPPSYNPNGYRLVANEGGIFDFGLLFNGSLANNHLNAPIVGIANSPGPAGYLMVGSDGGVFALGGANFYGSLGGQSLPSPIAAIAATPSEDGYWLTAQNGKIYNFGNVPALPAVQLPIGGTIVGMASSNTGKGAWLVDQYGNVYGEGDAQYEGGITGHINAPIVGIAAAASGQGYILVGSDGGVYYNMGFYGSLPGSLQPGQHLVAPIVGIAVTHSGNGYWEVGADGGVFNYGDAPFLGSIYTAIPGKTLNGPIVGIQHLGSAPAG